ncbi:MAG: sulfatase-like hydrolase/transferase [Planctomycetota bacterium]
MCSVASIAVADRSPNVLLILVDDLGYQDLSSQGATDFETPRLDALAASGVRFTAGYVTAPQCAPSRAGLLTGVNQSRFGFRDNAATKSIPPRESVQIISEQFKELGYTTGMIGKWHVDVQRNKNGIIQYPQNLPQKRGFDYVLSLDGGTSHYFPYSPEGKAWMRQRQWEPRLELVRREGAQPEFVEGLSPQTYLTDYLSEDAARFVQRNREQPWFLLLSYNAPHTPMQAKPNKMEKYAHINPPMRRAFVGMMDSLDEGVGQVLDALERTGQTERTIVWFLSDNGGPTARNGSRNDPFTGFKGDMYEGGIRVPFFMAWPGTLDGGREESVAVSALDILPTSLAAAGRTEIAPVHEGRNLLPWLRDGEPAPVAELYWSWRALSAARIGSLKLTRNGRTTKTSDGVEVPAIAFSDLLSNPRELPQQGLSDTQAKDDLSDRLDAWLTQLRSDEQQMTPPANE